MHIRGHSIPRASDDSGEEGGSSGLSFNGASVLPSPCGSFLGRLEGGCASITQCIRSSGGLGIERFSMGFNTGSRGPGQKRPGNRREHDWAR